MNKEQESKSDKKSPGFWFYTADYERDMQILSLAAQGLWARMLCWMHENEAHRGFAELPTGAPMTTADVAAKVGKKDSEVKKCLEEMERVGTYSRDERGCIYCRRMARDTHISEVRRAAAKSRMETSNRAASGKFAGDFAPAKQPAKREQNPTVTATDSATVSVSTTNPPNPPANSLARSFAEYPETSAAVRDFFPATEDVFVARLVQTVCQELISSDVTAAPSDGMIADAVRECRRTTKHQEGAGLFLRTVPQCVKTWLTQGRSVSALRELPISDKTVKAIEFGRLVERAARR